MKADIEKRKFDIRFLVVNCQKTALASGKTYHSPSRLKGGVYSSFALLFFCIYPSVNPSLTA